MSIAFNGAFFAWPYQAGVAAYVQERGLLDKHSRIYGTSSGAVVATMLACGVDVATVGFAAGLEANQRAMGDRKHPFFNPAPVLPTYFAIFGKTLPTDAHVHATHRLHVAVTQVPRLRSKLISTFTSNQAILDALGASVAIPGVTVAFAHKVPRHGWCVDGGPEAANDDRPGVFTLRVGVNFRIPRRWPEHIAPSRAIGWAQRFLIPAEARRRELYALGYADARTYLAQRKAHT